MSKIVKFETVAENNDSVWLDNYIINKPLSEF